MNRHAAILLFLTMALGSLSLGQTKPDTTKHAAFYEAIDQIQAIMKGAEYQHVRGYISPEAYVVSGKSFLPLAAVLQGKGRDSLLQENATRRVVQVTGRSNDAEDATYVVLKTISAQEGDVRYHSLVLYRKPGGVWQIFLWHVGV